MSEGDRIVLTCCHGKSRFGFIAFALGEILVIEIDGKDCARDGLMVAVVPLRRKDDGSYIHISSGTVMTINTDEASH